MRENPWTSSLPRSLQRLQHARRSLRALVAHTKKGGNSDDGVTTTSLSSPSLASPPPPAPRPAPRTASTTSMLPPQRPARRLAVHSVRDYPEHLNPFRDDPDDEVAVADDEEPELRPTQDKFGTWTVPRRRSHLNFEAWSGSRECPAASPSRPSSGTAPPRPPVGPRLMAASPSNAPRPPVKPRKKRKAPPPPPLGAPSAAPPRNSMSGAVSLPQLAALHQAETPCDTPTTSQTSLSSMSRRENADVDRETSPEEDPQGHEQTAGQHHPEDQRPGLEQREQEQEPQEPTPVEARSSPPTSPSASRAREAQSETAAASTSDEEPRLRTSPTPPSLTEERDEAESSERALGDSDVRGSDDGDAVERVLGASPAPSRPSSPECSEPPLPPPPPHQPRLSPAPVSDEGLDGSEEELSLPAPPSSETSPISPSLPPPPPPCPLARQEDADDTSDSDVDVNGVEANPELRSHHKENVAPVSHSTTAPLQV